MIRLNPLVLFSFGLFSLSLGRSSLRDLHIAFWAVGAVRALAAGLFLPSWPLSVAVPRTVAAFAAITIVYSTWRLGGHDRAQGGGQQACGSWCWPGPGSVMLGFLDPARLGDYLAQSLRLPARMVAAFSAALQRFMGFHLAWQQLERVRRIPGLRGRVATRWPTAGTSSTCRSPCSCRPCAAPPERRRWPWMRGDSPRLTSARCPSPRRGTRLDIAARPSPRPPCSAPCPWSLCICS